MAHPKLTKSQQRERRKQQRKIPSARLCELLAEYHAGSDDQPFTELHAAARLRRSRAWLQLRRVSGGGPRYLRTPSGRVYYRKGDIERYLEETLKAFDSTSQYPQAA